MSETQQSQPAKTSAEMDTEAYRSIPTLERHGTFVALYLAAISMGIGTESFWIGVGTFLSLFFLASAIDITMTKHRYLTKPKA